MPDPIAPISIGAEADIPSILAPEGAEKTPSTDFGQMLVGSIDRLEADLDAAAEESAALATGQAEDLTSVVLAVERASLEMQLAVQVRNRAVEAYQELFRMQI
jgi:flagellar hook-basal body complex protein FliE